MSVILETVYPTEGSSRTVTFTLVDNVGAPVPLANINTAALTLYDLGTYEPGGSPVTGIINNRDAQNVKNANDVTIHSTNGLVTWAMADEDNPIITTRRQLERHRAMFRFDVGGVILAYEFEIVVKNLNVLI